MNQTQLFKEVSNIGKRFGKDELAYFALTSKPELLLRDRLASRLNRQLYSEGYKILREWKRTDLAILKDRKPKILLEFKAMYTFDGVSSPREKRDVNQFPKLMLTDLKKAKRHTNKNTKIYSVLFAVHPLSVIDKNLPYARKINSAFKLHGNPETVKTLCEQNIKNFFKNKEKRIIKSGTINCGKWSGVKVALLFYIVG